jgi:uncharacterized membrane protein YczE
MKCSLFKKAFWIILGVIFVGAGAATTMKANIGIGAYDSVAKSLSDASGFQVGTMGMAVNCSCVLGSLLILKKEFGIKHILQIPFSILLGSVINFVYYEFFTFPVQGLVMGVIVYLIGQIVCALGVAIVMVVNEITFALEGFCSALTRIIPIEFAKMRQWADIVSVMITVAMKFIFNLPWAIGLGTIIGVIIFGPVMGFFMKHLEKIIN